MKRFSTILVVLFAAMGTAFPQMRYTAAVLDESTYNISNSHHCAIRHWQGSQSVAAINLGSGTVAFCLIDHSDLDNTFPYPPPMPGLTSRFAVFSDVNYPDLYINDMYVHNDNAFFCGGITGEAVYGYFDINGLNSTVITLNLYKIPSSPPFTAPISLEKLVVYDVGSLTHLVSYGYEKEDRHTSQSIIVEIQDVMGANTINSVETGYSAPPYPESYFYDDIVLTDSYVVVLGHDLNAIMPGSGTGFPIYSVGARGSVAADICAGGNYYLPVPWEANDRVAGVALPSDQFAMAYVNDHGWGNYYTRMRVIDLPTGTNPYSQEFNKPEKEYPVEMIYLDGLKAIELMQPVTDISNFVQLFPFAGAAYTTPKLNPSGDEFKSLTPIDGSRFIAARCCTLFFEDRTVSLPHQPSSSCPDHDYIEVEPIDELNPVNGTWGTFNFTFPNPDSQSPSVDQTSFKGCYSYE